MYRCSIFMDYKFNQFCGPETLSKEYKLFTFHPGGVNIDPNEESKSEDLLQSGEWIYNLSVLKNIDFYLEYYLPKYTSAFLNSESIDGIGEMFIGISNDGLVKGIPYKGSLDKNIIKEKVNNILKSDLVQSEIDISKYVKLDVIEVDNSDFKLNDEHQNLVENYFFQKKEYLSKINEYKKRKNIWCKVMMFYCDKLHNLLNKTVTRKQFLEYVIDKDPDNYNVINILKSDFIFNQNAIGNIGILKHKEKSLWYWLTKWKDDVTENIMKFRPSPPPYTQRVFAINIITTLVDMIPIWLDKADINLYLIKITFHKPEINPNIQYKFNSEYVSCYRNLFDDEPYCHPLF